MIRTFLGSALFVACMALAWDAQTFFLSPTHVVIAASALAAPLLVAAGKNTGQEVTALQKQSWSLLWPSLLSTIGVGFLLPYFAGHNPGTMQLAPQARYLGVAVFLSGYVIRLLATRKLRKTFSFLLTIQENRQLVTSGIFSLIRHPVYLGNILGVAGMFLVFSSWYGLVFVFVYTMLLAFRIRKDERLLMETFGSVYEEYSTKSFRLIPHIY